MADSAHQLPPGISAERQAEAEQELQRQAEAERELEP
jgi:hypothetical protein